MENANQVFEFYFSPVVMIDEEFSFSFIDDDTYAVAMHASFYDASFYDAYQAHVARHH